MGATFIITLREAFEAALILGIVYTYLERIGARDAYRYVTWGGVLGSSRASPWEWPSPTCRAR